MSIGMTYDEFWNQNVEMATMFRKADELKHRQRNYELWLQGMYVYEALCDASPLFRFTMKKGTIKPEPYVREPYPITQAELDEREARKAREREERMKAEFAAFAEAMRRKMPLEAHPDYKGGEMHGNHD